MNPAQIRKLQTLPRGRGTWQLGVAPGHAAIVDGSSGAPLLVVQGDGLVRAVTMVEVTDAAAWNALLFDAMARPVAPLQPGLPGTLRCRGAEIAEAIGPAAKRLKLRVEAGGDFSVLEQVEARLNQAMAVEGRVDFPDEDAALYAAAAAFARAAPWQYVDGEPQFHLTTPVRGWEAPVAVPLGQAGETYGLALYRDEASVPREDPGIADSVVVFLDQDADRRSIQRARRLGYDLVEGRLPTFMRLQPGHDPIGLASPHHARVLTVALRAVTAWYERFVGDEELELPLALGDGVSCRLDNPEVFWDMGYGQGPGEPS